jgi:hypothetical protein
MPRFADGPSRCSINLSRKNKSSGGVDFTVPVLNITDDQGTRKQEFPKGTDAAMRVFHDEVMKRLAAGWRLLIDEVPVEPQPAARYTAFPELEHLVEAEPADDDAWGVLGDAWTEAGDPRGECVLVARTVHNTDAAAFMRQKAAAEPALRIRNSELFGPFEDDAYRVRTKFVRGLVDTVELIDERHAPGRPTHQLLEQVLTNPFARFLTRLTIGGPDVATLIETISKVGAGALRSLVLHQQVERSQIPVQIGRASERLPRLRRLVLRLEHAPIDWTGARFAALAELEIEEPGSPALCTDFLAWIASHPAVETVTISQGLSSRDSGQIEKLLEGWAADQSRWPASLREVKWRHRTIHRSR